MSAVLDLPILDQKIAFDEINEKSIIFALEEKKHALFFDVAYKTYAELIEKFPARRDPRLTFDRGVLEIMPLPKHDVSERMIDELVSDIAIEFDIDYVNYGSSTQNRIILDRGFEPDSSFYFGKNAELMRYRDRFLESDPPPDLVFEVDVTHSSLDKFPLMASFGVKEVWRYEKNRLRIYWLEESKFVEADFSQFFPNLTTQILNDFILGSNEKSRIQWRKEIRQWAKNQVKNEK